VATIDDRLRRLEDRIVPPPESVRDMSLLLKLMFHARAVLDYRDRQAAAGAGRLEVGDDVTEPGPLVLTLAEKRSMLEGHPRWLKYLAHERTRAHAGLADRIAAAEKMAHKEAARLREEVRIEESIEVVDE
jgi:hypothetical protein